jgi:SAM-dependent methyltransferase
VTHRSTEVEVMDDPDLPDEVLAEAHRHITRVNRWLGNTRSIIEWVRHDPEVRRVLDLGCGDGAILADIRAALGVEVEGVDLRPPLKTLAPVITGDAAHDALPKADVAISVLTAHHMSEADVLAMMRNAARSCRRLIILDLVRHPIPEKLFRWFLAPFLPAINRQDGEISVRRAFTAAELFALAEQSGADRIVHQVAPLNLRQIIELTWKKGCRPSPDSDPRSSS